jgi:hypothetical protein
MTIKSIFTYLFSIPKVPTNSKKDEQELIKRVVSMISSGNVYLQNGYYLTGEDINEQIKAIL